MALSKFAESDLLCEKCRGSPKPEDGSLRICIRKEAFQESDYTSRTSLIRVLAFVSAVRNSPGENAWQESWRILCIHVVNKGPSQDCLTSFWERLSDRMNSMVRDSCFARNFTAKEEGDTIILHMRGCSDFLATVDYMSPESCDKGLLSLTLDRFHDVMFPTMQSESSAPRSVFSGTKLVEGATVNITESTHLQFKSLVEGQKLNKKLQKGSSAEYFSPKSGKDFVEWLWEKFPKTLGEYISAFAKFPEGGIYCCGIREEKEERTRDGERKVNKIRPLHLTDKWKEEIKEEIRRRVKNDLLWVTSNEKRGFQSLTAEETEKIVDERKLVVTEFHLVDPSPESAGSSAVSAKKFAPPGNSSAEPGKKLAPPGKFFAEPGKNLAQPGNSSAEPKKSLYILEVKVAHFRGIVFCSKGGPEAYKFGEDDCIPERMEADEWLSKAMEYRWCRTHKRKKVRCGEVRHCKRCKGFDDNTGHCANVKKLEECEKCSQGNPEMAARD